MESLLVPFVLRQGNSQRTEIRENRGQGNRSLGFSVFCPLQALSSEPDHSVFLSSVLCKRCPLNPIVRFFVPPPGVKRRKLICLLSSIF
ncbi:MAG: hypothetical protein LBD06_11165 [Candidatus Accumulibacter sp.]|nr:hypothetical protein [Accumulibacter sp.]